MEKRVKWSRYGHKSKRQFETWEKKKINIGKQEAEKKHNIFSRSFSLFPMHNIHREFYKCEESNSPECHAPDDSLKYF